MEWFTSSANGNEAAFDEVGEGQCHFFSAGNVINMRRVEGFDVMIVIPDAEI